jgi:hypothetical protein
MNEIVKTLKEAEKEVCIKIASIHIKHEKLADIYGLTDRTKEMIDMSKEIVFLGDIAEDIEEIIERLEVFETNKNIYQESKNNA